MTTNDAASCRIGLMSRIDFGGDGFRQALLELAAEDFRRENVNYIVLAGGLVSARAVKERQIKIARDMRVVKAQIKALEKQKTSEKPDKKKDAKAEAERRKLLQQLDDLVDQAKELTAEKLADRLAECIPSFTNTKGDTVKLYIIPSPAYDKDLGEEIAQLLAHKRSKDIRVYKAGGDRLTVKQAGKVMEVLVPMKAVWMRGDYMSTPVERVIKDKRKQTSSKPPDLQVIGCFGGTITKPKGEMPIPYVSVPVLHNIEEATVAENQIGVRVIDVFRDRAVPDARTYNYKDHVSVERSFIRAPSDLTASQQKIIEVLMKQGRMSASMLSDNTRLSRETVESDLKAMVRSSSKPLKTWPGLIYYKDSLRWDFAREWMRTHMRYPALPAERKVDSLVAVGCPHFGAVTTDYFQFLTEIPKVMLERDANILVMAGDLAEGIKHNLALRLESYPGLNITDMEELAGKSIGEVTIKVFKARFAKALEELVKKSKDGKPSADQLAALVSACLLLIIYIKGNHDDWQTDSGTTPLVSMRAVLVERICKGVEEMLAKHGLCLLSLNQLVQKKVVYLRPEDSYTLPSGLKLAVLHPYMARSKTTSLRLQEMLDKKPDCQVVIGANFHVGEHLELWEGDLGQRVCLELGTLKHYTGFEDTKLKIVDQGFGYLRVESVNKRILVTENTFYNNDLSKATLLDPRKPFKDLLQLLGL